MKCLVTGASGFIGSYLVEFLAKEGHQVTALGRARTPAACQCWVSFTFVEADLLDRKNIACLIDSVAPRSCFPPGCSELSECLLETTRTYF